MAVVVRRDSIARLKSSVWLRRKASSAFPTPTLKFSDVLLCSEGDVNIFSNWSHFPVDQAASAAKGRVLGEKELEA